MGLPRDLFPYAAGRLSAASGRNTELARATSAPSAVATQSITPRLFSAQHHARVELQPAADRGTADEIERYLEGQETAQLAMTGSKRRRIGVAHRHIRER